jgi:uncharacterized membrane protein YesL
VAALKPQSLNGFAGAWRSLATAGRLLVDNGLPLLIASLLWWIAAPLILFSGPATLSLYRVARIAAAGQRVELRELGRSWRGGYRWSSIHALGWLVGSLGIILNARLYSAAVSPILIFSLALPLLLLWGTIGLFLFPVALQHDSQRFRSNLRAAVTLIASQPQRTIGVWLGFVLITVVCIVVPVLIFIWPGMLALWGSTLARPAAPA